MITNFVCMCKLDMPLMSTKIVFWQKSYSFSNRLVKQWVFFKFLDEYNGHKVLYLFCVKRIYSRVATWSVGKVWRAGELGTLTNAHLCNTLVPTLDDFTTTQAEFEWAIPITGGVKLLSVGQGASVVNHYGLASLRVGLAWKHKRNRFSKIIEIEQLLRPGTKGISSTKSNHLNGQWACPSE